MKTSFGAKRLLHALHRLRRPLLYWGCPMAVAALLAAPALQAQQLEPRAFAPNPVGVSFLSLSTGWSEGDVLLDPAAPIEDFEVEYNDLIISYARTFALRDRLASVAIALPYVNADASGIVNGEPRETSRAGLGDLRLRLTASLLPDSAQDMAAFASAPPARTLAASLVVAAPSGEYFDDRLVNIGANRWAFKPEIGGSVQLGRWSLEGSAGAWFFAPNDEFFGGSRKTQDPLAIIQGHVIYNFAPRLWVGMGLTGYAGGQSEVDGQALDDRQENTRAGVAMSWPIGRQHSLRGSWSTGTSTRAGGEFDYFSLAWTYLWLH